MTESKLAKASTKSATAITKAQAGLLSQILDEQMGQSSSPSTSRKPMMDGKLSRITRRSSSPTFYCLHIQFFLTLNRTYHCLAL